MFWTLFILYYNNIFMSKPNVFVCLMKTFLATPSVYLYLHLYLHLYVYLCFYLDYKLCVHLYLCLCLYLHLYLYLYLCLYLDYKWCVQVILTIPIVSQVCGRALYGVIIRPTIVCKSFKIGIPWFWGPSRPGSNSIFCYCFWTFRKCARDDMWDLRWGWDKPIRK